MFRPLSKLGKIQSKCIARFALQALRFDMVFCSRAKRALQTLKPFKKTLSKKSIIVSDEIAPDCGLAGYKNLMQSKAFTCARDILIIGHQPDLESFARYITPHFHALVPKGALMRFVIDKNAQSLEGSGVIDFVLPPHILQKLGC